MAVASVAPAPTAAAANLSAPTAEPASACAYCTLPLGGGRKSLQSRAGGLLAFCCQGCSWAYQVFGGRDEGSPATLVAARLLAAFAASMVVMEAGWGRYLDAIAQGGRVVAPPPFAVAGPSPLEAFYARVYEPLAALVVFILLGWPIVRGGVASLARGGVGLDALVSFGVLAAYGVSLAATVRGEGATYYDTASMILVFVTAGRYLEATARARAARGLRRLLATQPAEAEVLRGDTWLTARADAVTLDDLVLVRPGAAFPVDGLVLQGTGSVNEAPLTGESSAVLKRPGDEVVAGAISYDGMFRVQPTRVGAATFVRQVEALVERARGTKAPVERLADRIAAALTVLAVIAGAGTFLYWTLVRNDPLGGLLHALAVLLIACPCALGIATPLALRVGLAQAAQRRILIRDAATLETLGRVNRLFLDKTGTLTVGRPRLRQVDLAPGAGLEAPQALALAAALGRESEHPASRALLEAAGGCDADLPRVARVRAWPGLGVSGVAGGERNPDDTARPRGSAAEPVALGSPALMQQLGFRAMEVVAQPGETLVFLGVGDRVRAAFRLVDALRPAAAHLARSLDHTGIRATLLTGDGLSAAAAIAAEVAIRDVEANLRAGDKAQRVAGEPRRGGAVAMLGDGVNDAPALAVADVGLAMGSGTDLARTAAPVVLPGDDLAQVAWLFELARRVRATIWMNLFWATAYNVVGIGLAAAGLLQPVLAAAAMVASSLLVLGNSLRLQWREEAAAHAPARSTSSLGSARTPAPLWRQEQAEAGR